jgi:hypothetical protein
MQLEQLTHVLGWWAALSYGLLVIWFGLFILTHDTMYRIHNKWFDLSMQQFDLFNYCAMGMFKLLIFIFTLGPYLALCIAV